jgi:hypothetical protein
MSDGSTDLRARALQRVGALFAYDDRGRMTGVNQWDGGVAPRFFLMRTPDRVIARFRDDVPDDLAARLEEIAMREPPGAAPPPRPVHERAYLYLLAAHAPVGPTGAGPSYTFVAAPPSAPAPVAIGPANADLLAGAFDDWADDVGRRDPFMAIVREGRAVAICASVRISAAVHCAGVETHPDWRGRGHAVSVVAGWARAVRAAGAAPCYSTSWENVASQGVARRLGLGLMGVDFHVG